MIGPNEIFPPSARPGYRILIDSTEIAVLRKNIDTAVLISLNKQCGVVIKNTNAASEWKNATPTDA